MSNKSTIYVKPPVKPLRWVGSSLNDISSFPDDAKAKLGHALRIVQRGEHPENEEHLHGDLSGVRELVADSEDGNTYRSVFTIKMDPFIFVLHCFLKKSRSGRATPKRDLDLIRKRLKDAKAEYSEIQKEDNPKTTQGRRQ